MIIDRRHAHVKPLGYPADGGIDIELAHEFKIRPLDILALCADDGKAVYALMQATLEVSKQIRAILRIEDVQDKRAVIHKILEPLNNILTPFII